MNMNGDTSELEQLLQRLEALDAEAQAEVERAKAVLDLAVQRQRMLRAMLRTSGRVEPKAKRSGRRVSDQKRAEVLAAIQAHTGDQFTAREIIDATKITQASVNAALVELRDEGVIRKAGKAPTTGGPTLWKLESDG